MSSDLGKKVMRSSADRKGLTIGTVNGLLEWTHNVAVTAKKIATIAETEFSSAEKSKQAQNMALTAIELQPALAGMVSDSGGAPVRESECRFLLGVGPRDIEEMKVEDELERAIEQVRSETRKQFEDAAGQDHIDPEISSSLRKFASKF